VSAEVAALVGSDAANEIGATSHTPSFVALKLGEMLREACEQFHMDRFAFVQIDKERASLIDHVGACERILKTPLPMVYAIKIRRFIALFLVTLPFALLNRVHGDWLVPFITMMVAYPLVSLDQIGIELQNPFSVDNLSHLPLEGISATIQQNLEGLLKARPGSDGRPMLKEDKP
jgi:putative membrane protein